MLLVVLVVYVLVSLGAGILRIVVSRPFPFPAISFPAEVLVLSTMIEVGLGLGLAIRLGVAIGIEVEIGVEIGVICAKPFPAVVTTALEMDISVVVALFLPLLFSFSVPELELLPELELVLELEVELMVTGIIVNAVTAPLFASGVVTLMIVVLGMSWVGFGGLVVAWMVGSSREDEDEDKDEVDIEVVPEKDSFVFVDSLAVVMIISVVLVAGCVVGSSGEMAVCASDEEEEEEDFDGRDVISDVRSKIVVGVAVDEEEGSSDVIS